MRFNAGCMTDASLPIQDVMKLVKAILKAGFTYQPYGLSTISLLLRASVCFVDSNRPQGHYRLREALLK